MSFKSPISILQEMGQKNGTIPLYTMVNSSRDSEFVCYVQSGKHEGIGVATTKKMAKHNAAENCLKGMGFFNINSRMETPTKNISLEDARDDDTKSYDLMKANLLRGDICSDTDIYKSRSASLGSPLVVKNCVSQLNEYASTNSYPYPLYEDQMSVEGFTVICRFVNLTSTGRGRSKKDAKQEASKNMLTILETHAPIKDDLKNVDNLDDTAIIEAYKKLSLSTKTTKEHSENMDVVPRASRTFTRRHKETELTEDDSNKLEKMEDALLNSDITYDIVIRQTSPFIVVFKLTGLSVSKFNVVLMGMGETFRVAKINVLRKAMNMLESGFFSTRFD